MVYHGNGMTVYHTGPDDEGPDDDPLRVLQHDVLAPEGGSASDMPRKKPRETPQIMAQTKAGRAAWIRTGGRATDGPGS